MTLRAQTWGDISVSAAVLASNPLDSSARCCCSYTMRDGAGEEEEEEGARRHVHVDHRQLGDARDAGPLLAVPARRAHGAGVDVELLDVALLGEMLVFVHDAPHDVVHAHRPRHRLVELILD